MPAQQLVEHPPPPDLAPFADALWHVRIADPGIVRLLPTGCGELLVYRNRRGAGLTVVGPMSRAQTNTVYPGDLYAGVRLKIGTRVLLGQLAGRTLCDARLRGYAIADDSVRALEEDFGRLSSAPRILERLAGFARELVCRRLLVRDPLIDRFIAAAAAGHGGGRAGTLLTALPLSPRQFRRRLLAHTGLTPKALLRLYRQQAVLRDLATGDASITAIAARHHYTDHAHLTHEFRASIGLTPIQLRHALVLHRPHR